MAIGDIKGEEAIIRVVTAGAAVTKGQVVHIEADGKWDPVVTTDTGKFGVAIEAASADGVEFRAVIWGRVEITATAAAIAAHELVEAGTTGMVLASAGTNVVVGTAMEAFASSGSGTIWVGLVG